ncbi:MAG: hypothetical protein ACE5I4_08830, partial [Thermoplasmata archaeon]
YNDSGPPILVNPAPNATDLAAFNVPANPEVNPGDVYYLNNTLGTIRDDSGILAAYQTGSHPDTVYGRVTPDGGQTVVQYWFYYAFNPGVWNNHEGDWEMVQATVSGSTPTEVAYAQHHDGQRMPWDSENAFTAFLPTSVQREGTHPKVYVALGAHASYLRPYQGHLGISGDMLSDQGPVWRPGDYPIVNLGEQASPSAGNEWLQFAGRWGEFSVPAHVRAEAGPPGPAFRSEGAMFGTPVEWAAALAVPSVFNLSFQWILANIWLVFWIGFALGVVGTLIRIWRRHRRTKAGVWLWPFAHLLPFDRKSVAMVLALVGLIVGVVGFFYPWWQVNTDINAPGFLVTGGFVTFLEIGGLAGILINPMKIGDPDALVNLLPIPLAAFFLILSAWFVFRITGTKTSRKLGGRFGGRAVILLLPFVAVFVLSFFSFFGLLTLPPGGINPDVILEPVFANPFGGEVDLTFEGGTASVAWGLGLGAWILFGAAGIMIAAAVLAFSQRYEFVTPAPSAPPE